jgi:hypothetical protein
MEGKPSKKTFDQEKGRHQMQQIFPLATSVGFLELVLRERVGRVRTRSQALGDRGASAVEWVVISAITLTIAIAVGGILLTALQGKANDVSGRIGNAGAGGGAAGGGGAGAGGGAP